MKAIELIRVSTEAQAGSDRASIPAQRTVNRTTAARFGLTIVQTIELTDVSGTSVLLTPEIQRLIILMQGDEIGAVITREFSRLMRPEKFSDYALLQAFADTRTKLYLPEGPIDFSEKSGRLMGTIRAAIAGLERSEIQERCWRGKEEKRKAGKNVAPILPIGVSYDKLRGWSYNEESRRVRQAFDMILSGITTYAEVSRRTAIRQGSMSKLLRNPIWNGWRVYEWRCDSAHRIAGLNGRQGYSPEIRRNPEDVIRVKVMETPLLSDQEWSSAMRIMDAKRDSHRRERVNKSRFVYGGFLFCALCNSPMVAVSKYKSNDRYYVCRTRKYPGRFGPRCEQGYIRAIALEKAVDEVLTREVTSKDFAERIADQMVANSKDAVIETKIERLEAEILAAQSKRDRVVDAYVDGVITKTVRDARLKTVDTRLALAGQELLQARHTRMPALTADGIAKAFEPFKQWDLLSREDRRRILALTVPRIKVNNLSVTGFYRLLDGCDVDLGKPNAQPIAGRIKHSYSCIRNVNVTMPPGVWIDLRVA